MSDDPAVTVAVELVRAVELAVCVAVAAVLLQRWRARRAPATAAALGVFAVLAAVIAAGYWQPEDTTRGAALVWSKATVVVLLALPSLLVVLAHALGGVGRRARDVALWLYGAQVVVTVAVPPLPGPEATERPTWALVYTAVVLVAWTALSLVAARALWRSGRAQSSVVRHRMRSLATGAVVLSAALVASGAAGPDQRAWVRLAVLFTGLCSILLFAVAFLLPATLRLVWRQGDLVALGEAERGLMTAVTRQQVAETIVPVLGEVFGGAAAVLDLEGRPVRPERADDPSVVALAELVGSAARSGGPVQEVAGGVLAARLDQGWLVVQAGRLAPVFGDDEAALLGRVATMVDLALQRAALFEQEKASRLTAEAASAELETLLYSVSHDLRSPLISVLGYLDFLRAEHGPSLTGDGQHYLERITVNAVYMQSLIADLLELSRIGRSDPPAQRLDLGRLADEVVDGARLSHPAAQVAVRGPVPTVRMSDVRARQLLTNLVDNALKHGGREDLRVTVSVSRTDDGGVRLEVADDGRGVPPEYRTRVLRVFERLDAPKSSAGTGMGLAICKRIADSLGGTVVVDGPPPGAASGTTVRVELPAAVVVDGPDVPSPRQPATTPAPAGT